MFIDAEAASSSIIISLFFVIFGACLGSFASAIIYRVPRNISWIFDSDDHMSVSQARSCCPSCGRSLSLLDLIPIFSWLFSRGRCRYCKGSISVNYLLYELIFMCLSSVTWLILNDIFLSFCLSLIWVFCFSFLVVFIKHQIVSKQLIFVIFGLICFIISMRIFVFYA